MRYTGETKNLEAWMESFRRQIHSVHVCFERLPQVIFEETIRRKCYPNLSDINFAVPSISVLKDFGPYRKECKF